LIRSFRRKTLEYIAIKKVFHLNPWQKRCDGLSDRACVGFYPFACVRVDPDERRSFCFFNVYRLFAFQNCQMGRKRFVWPNPQMRQYDLANIEPGKQSCGKTKKLEPKTVTGAQSVFLI